jgi:small-conductance mechanosensitive channel
MNLAGWGGMMARLSVLFLLLLLSGASLRAEEAPATTGEPAPLEVYHRHITTFRAIYQEMLPWQRAQRVVQKIKSVDYAHLEDPISSTIVTLEGRRAALISIGNNMLFGISERDLDPDSDVTLEQATAEAILQLKAVIKDMQDAKNSGYWIKAGGLILGWTAGLAAWVVLLTVLRRKILVRLDAFWLGRKIIFNATVRRIVVRLVEHLLDLAAWVLGLAFFYVWLEEIFWLIPQTRSWGEHLWDNLGRLVDTILLGIADALPGLALAVCIFVIARILIGLLREFFDTVEEDRVGLPGLYPDTIKATRRLCIAMVWIFALVLAYPYLPGAKTAAFQGVSVFLGLMLTLGSSGLVSQAMSGLVVVYTRAFRPGELIRIGDVEGVVSELGIFSAKLVTPTKQEITIPYSLAAGSVTRNLSRLTEETGVILATTVSIGYDAPWRQVHAMLALAAERTKGVRKDPKPFARQNGLSDFYVEYELLFSIETPETRGIILSELHAHIQDVFNEFGVQIMSPNFEAQPEGKVVVPKAKWFESPSAPEKPKE